MSSTATSSVILTTNSELARVFLSTEKATNPKNKYEDWEFIMSFCDGVNLEQDGWVAPQGQTLCWCSLNRDAVPSQFLWPVYAHRKQAHTHSLLPVQFSHMYIYSTV